MNDPGLNKPLRELLYRAHEGGDADNLAVAASGWLDAVHSFGVDALAAGAPTSEVLPAVVQMLEGWMVARDAGSLATTWAALDGAVTLLERRLAEVRNERDRLATLSEALLRERRRQRHRRGRGRGNRGQAKE